MTQEKNEKVSFMSNTVKMIKIIFITGFCAIIAACSSGGSVSSSGLNLNGTWVATANDSLNRTFEMTLVIAQDEVTSSSNTVASADINLEVILRDNTGFVSGTPGSIAVCVLSASGGTISQVTNTISVGAGTGFSVVGDVSNSQINVAISSDEDGCGIFSVSANFVRA